MELILNSQYVLDTGSYSAIVIDSLGCQHYSDTITISSNQYKFPYSYSWRYDNMRKWIFNIIYSRNI